MCEVESGPHLSVPSSQFSLVISTYNQPKAERMNFCLPLLFRQNREVGGGGEAERTRNTHGMAVITRALRTHVREP